MRTPAFLLLLLVFNGLAAQEVADSTQPKKERSHIYLKLAGGASALGLAFENSSGEKEQWQATPSLLFQVGATSEFNQWYYGFMLDVLQSNAAFQGNGLEAQMNLKGVQLGILAGWSPNHSKAREGIVLKPRLGASAHYFMLGTAEQRLNSQLADLIASNELQPGDFALGVHAGVTLQDYTSGLGFSFELGYRLGLTNLENDPNQSAYLRGMQVLVGMRYALFTKKK
jgi:hypothetical protein